MEVCNHFCLFWLIMYATFELTSGVTNCVFHIMGTGRNNNSINCSVSENVPNDTLVFDAKQYMLFNDTTNIEVQAFVGTLETAFTTHFVVIPQFPLLLPNGELKTKGDFDREQMFSAVGGAQRGRDPIVWQVGLIIMNTRTGTNWEIAMRIEVIDINDNIPTFSRPVDQKSSNEEVRLSVFLLPAVDTDEQRNAILSYELQNDYSGLFRLAVRLNPVEDTVRLESTDILDRETRSRYEFVVIARDGGNRTGTLNVILDVLDINDNPPVVEMSSYSVIIKENSTAVQPVININATDDDIGDFGTLSFSIEVMRGSNDVTSDDIFTINQTSGEIATNRILDREQAPNYHLTVEVADGGNPPRSVIVTVDVDVIDVNDNDPHVEIDFNQLTSGKVRENFELDSSFATMTVTDPDEGENGEFNVSRLVDLDAENGLQSQIELRRKTSPQNTWDLVVVSSLDRETRESYALQITVSDRGSPPRYTTYNLSFSLHDINDNAPMFNMTYSVNVREDVGIGHTVVPNIRAYDRDIGTNANLNYSLSLNSAEFPYQNLFTIHPTLGNLMVKSALDRESVAEMNGESELNVEVIATDMGVPSLSGQTSIHLVLIDVNDNQPIFTTDTFETRVLENSEASLIQTFSATDPDLPPFNNVTYSIMQPGDFFSIDPSSGELRTTRELNREETAVHYIQIGASDSLLLPNFINFTVYVDDENDVPPRFDDRDYIITIPENASINSVVTVLSVDDPDLNNRFQFTIVSGDDEDKFMVRPSGEVIVAASLDRETTENYTLVISVMDEDFVAPNQAVVVITLSDINDHFPQFNQSSYMFYVTEGSQTTTDIGTVYAYSNDAGQNSIVSYRITGGNNAGSFTINPDNGVITAEPEIDRESNEMFELIIMAQDGGRPPLSNTTTVTVVVRDINDNGPVFDPTNDTVSLREDHSLMQTFYTATAMDADDEDNAIQTYSIVRSSYGSFDIDATTGAVSLLSTLDFETASSVLVVIQAVDRDQSDFSANLYLNITVEDIDDRLPRFPSDFPTSLSVNETRPSRSIILTFQAIVSSTSPASHFNYLLSNHMDDFALLISADDEASIQVLSLDREERSGYALNITIINTIANLSNSKVLNIIITDANDNLPVFSMSQYTFEVAENSVGADVGTVIANDTDDHVNSIIRYTFQDTSNLFRIDPETGRIQTIASLDYDTVQEHSLVVWANDMGNPSRSASASVSISVIDVNDNPPQFSVNQKYEFMIDEDTAVGMRVATIRASDIDSGVFGDLTYSIQSGNVEDRFSIAKEGGNGIVTIKAPLDRETVSQYALIIAVTDNNNNPGFLQVRGTFNITVLDTNDNSPVFSDSQVYSATVPENHMLSDVITTISATDDDDGANAVVNYMLGSGNYKNSFSINPRSGELRAVLTLDYEMNIFYPLEVIAFDSGSPRRRSVQLFNITVTNVNDHVPQFTLSSYKFTLREGVPSASMSTKVRAVDGDSGVMGEVTYTILRQIPANDFDIDGTSGVIRPHRSLDYERHCKYTLTVEAVDRDRTVLNRRSSETIVNIVVENVNDNHPVYLNLPHTIQLSEMVSINTVAYVALAVDADGDTLQYSITGGNNDNKFTMNSQTGEVFVSSSLDGDVVSSYELTISVTDGLNTRDGVLTVTVEDVNDNAPVFAQPPHTIYVSEGTSVGDVVEGIVATDIDKGFNSQLEYSLVEPSEYFSINSSSGNLTLLVPLDRDSFMPNSISLQVMVTDMGIVNRNSNTTSVEVVVTDENDSPPVFTKSVFRFTIPRDFSAGVTFGVLNATDADEGTNAQHLFTITVGLNLFNLNNTSGELSLMSSLPAGSTPLYQIGVRVVDLHNQNFLDTASVEIVVTDPNDRPPVFPQEKYSIDLMESLVPPQSIMMVTATDDDSGSNGEIMYRFGKPQSHFTINDSTGDIELTDRLDHEHTPVFTLLVYAINRNGRNSSTIVNITVLDVNDNTPQFQDLPTSLRISEVPYTGIEILRVVATDPDSDDFGRVSYSLINEAARDQFNIDNVTGVVTNLVELTAGASHVLEFEAADGSGNSNEMSITLTVINLSSQSPNFGQPSTSVMVPENFPINAVVHQFNASNQLEPPVFIQYQLSNFTDKVFALNETTGELVLVESLDFEQVESYHFVLEAYQTVSGTRYSSYLEVVIVVEDINDNAPVFTSTYVVASNIRESINMNREVANVHANDADSEENGQVTYAIIDGNEGGVFSIGPTNGQIVVIRSLDRESVDAYRLVVTATDEGRPSLSATAVVAVTVTDDNDVTPSFRNDSYIFRISENSALHSLVGVASAVDPDLTPAQLRYILSSLTASLDGMTRNGIPLTHFQVNQSSGAISLNHNLNRNSVDKFELQVTVTDGVNTNSTSVTVIVEDSNDNRPMFPAATDSVSIPELSDVGTSVFQLTASDNDFRLNGIVRYSLGDDWPSGQFDIDPLSGIVTLLKPAPVYETTNNGVWVTGTVVATDMGSAPLSSSVTVTVSLFDVNNHPPSLLPHYSADVFDIETVGTRVLNITASDRDEGPNAQISYYISNPHGPISVPFEIDQTTGRIAVSGVLTPGRVTFTVIAVNENPDPFATRFILSNTTSVEITVNRMNIYTPQFNQTTYQTMVLETDNTGGNVIQVFATDDDEDTTISYSIRSSDILPFAIDGDGVISISGTVDREEIDSYNFVIVATDDGVPPKNATAGVSITVLDVNDNEPVFSDGVFKASVTENVKLGMPVTTITATDRDEMANAKLSYALNDTSVFDIDQSSGKIVTSGHINREEVGIYYLEITAKDSGNPIRSSSAIVLVSVDGVNEFRPMFNTSQVVTFRIPDGLTAGSVVGKLYADDGDQGSGGELKFTFFSYKGPNDPDDYFYINSSGYIFLNVTARGAPSSVSTSRRKRQADDSSTDSVTISTVVRVEDSETDPYSDDIEITLVVPRSYIIQTSPTSEESPKGSPIVVVVAAICSAVAIAAVVLIVVCVLYRYRRRGRNKLYSPTITITESNRPPGEHVTTKSYTSNGNVHSDMRTETPGTRLTAISEAGHAQISTTSDSEPASGIFGDDESESVSGMQSRARVNNPEHVSPSGRHRSPQHSRPPPISRSTSDLAAVVNGHNPNGFLQRPDDEEAHPYTRDQLIAIYAANANLLTNSPSQDSIHMFGSEGGGEADGDIDMDNYMFAKFAGGLDSADEESVVGMNNDAYTVSSRGRSSIASRSSGGGIDEGSVDLWQGSRTSGFRPHRVTDVIDEMHAAVLSQDSLSQSKEKRKPKQQHMMQFQETSFTKKPTTSGSYTRQTGSMQNVRYPDHVGNSQYEAYNDGRRSSKSHYASSGAIYPLSYSSRASELTLPPYRPGEAPPPYGNDLSPPIRPVKPAEIRRDSQSSDSDSSEYQEPNPPVASYGPQPISPQPSLPTTNSTISLDNPIFQSPTYSKHYKAAKGAMPHHPHSGSVPQINMYNAGSVLGSSIGQGMDRQQRYNVNNGNLRA